MNLPVPDELISAYFDGEATPAERAEVEQLLDSSPEFRQQLDEISKLSALLHSFPRESAPAGLTANIQKRVDAAPLPTAPSSHPTPARSWRREWTAFGAGILATMASLLAMVSVRQLPLHQNSDQMAELEHTGPAPDQLAFGRFSKSAAPEAAPEDGIAMSQATAPVDSIDQPMNAEMEAASAMSSFAAGAAMESHENAPPRAKLNSADHVSTDPTLGEEISPVLVAEMIDPVTNTIQPQSQQDFLSSLTNGDVVVSRIADPTNTVAVIDLTVVDIERGAEELKLLLQKRSVLEVNDEASGAAKKRDEHKAFDDRRQLKGDSDRKESDWSDELQVFYVRAPGDQLASTLDDLIKIHPDLYRNWSPQPPIELPAGTRAMVGNYGPKLEVSQSLAGTDPTNEAHLDRESVELPEEVNEEANIAVTYLATRNALINSLGERNNTSQPAETFGATSANDGARSQPAATDEPSQPEPGQTQQKDRDTTNGVVASGNDKAYFRVSRESMPALGISNGVMGGMGPQAAIPPLANQVQNFDLNFGPRNRAQALSDRNDRTQKLVRMLIVLRSEQSPASKVP
ncbi:anti-sigma factor family protein [Schlesneria sp. T3-172]|uniref:anti-sigma factor family protein n=1 Tax=Schlesneria sphaerica TaxID=3373610 RepID=UPI0037C6E357